MPRQARWGGIRACPCAWPFAVAHLRMHLCPRCASMPAWHARCAGQSGPGATSPDLRPRCPAGCLCSACARQPSSWRAAAPAFPPTRHAPAVTTRLGDSPPTLGGRGAWEALLLVRCTPYLPTVQTSGGACCTPHASHRALPLLPPAGAIFPHLPGAGDQRRAGGLPVRGSAVFMLSVPARAASDENTQAPERHGFDMCRFGARRGVQFRSARPSRAGARCCRFCSAPLAGRMA